MGRRVYEHAGHATGFPTSIFHSSPVTHFRPPTKESARGQARVACTLSFLHSWNPPPPRPPPRLDRPDPQPDTKPTKLALLSFSGDEERRLAARKALEEVWVGGRALVLGAFWFRVKGSGFGRPDCACLGISIFSGVAGFRTALVAVPCGGLH